VLIVFFGKLPSRLAREESLLFSSGLLVHPRDRTEHTCTSALVGNRADRCTSAFSNRRSMETTVVAECCLLSAECPL